MENQVKIQVSSNIQIYVEALNSLNKVCDIIISQPKFVDESRTAEIDSVNQAMETIRSRANKELNATLWKSNITEL